jgi:hypothetical protein
MGQEKSRRIWPHGANHVLTTRDTGEQYVRWLTAAGMFSMKPHLGVFLARAADFYCARLEARRRMAQRLEKDGKL